MEAGEMPAAIYALAVEVKPLGGYGLLEAQVTLPDGRVLAARHWVEARAVYQARRLAWRALEQRG